MPDTEPWSQKSDRQPSPLRPRVFPHGQNDLTQVKTTHHAVNDGREQKFPRSPTKLLSELNQSPTKRFEDELSFFPFVWPTVPPLPKSEDCGC